ncbi:hypothetical protein BDB01DRAFT_790811 [Pilobolus umbonatus]|nr:hypothetical protein BDB01DRAFT_790811 [Pilobolus umbonatus]
MMTTPISSSTRPSSTRFTRRKSVTVVVDRLSSVDRFTCISHLMSIHMSSVEDISEFNNRFFDLKIKTNITDEDILYILYTRALPTSLYEEVISHMASMPFQERRDIFRVMSTAQCLYNKSIKKEKAVAGSSLGNRSSSGTQHIRARSPESHNDTKRQKRDSSSHKSESSLFCRFHKVGSHKTEDCRALAEAMERSIAPKRRVKTGECRKCMKPGWTPEHLCRETERSDTTTTENEAQPIPKETDNTKEIVNGSNDDIFWVIEEHNTQTSATL